MEHPRIERISDYAEVAGTQLATNTALLDITFKLRVIPCVKALGAQFKTAAVSLTKHEALKQGQVPIVAAGPA